MGKRNKKTRLSKPKPAVHFADVNLNEDDAASEALGDTQGGDEEMEEGNSDEFFDILDVFDGKTEVDEESQPRNLKRDGDANGSAVLKMVEECVDEDEDEEDDNDEEDEEDETMALSASDEEPSPEALASLDMFISGLDTSHKRKEPPEANVTDTRARKRRMIKERTESGVESEFGVRASGTSMMTTKNSPVYAY